MVDPVTIGGALSSFSALSQAAQSLLHVRDTALIQGKVVELQAAIIGAQNEAMALQASQAPLLARVHDLEREVVRFKNWEAEKQRYQLEEVVVGVFAYSQKPGMEEGEPRHRLCANCFQNGEKSFLSRLPVDARDVSLVCARCKTTLRIYGIGVRFVPDAHGQPIYP